MTKDQANLLLSELSKLENKTYYNVALLSMNTGLRIKEIINLTWQCINIEAGTILIVDSKDKKNNEFAYMTGEIKELFTSLHSQNNQPQTNVFDTNYQSLRRHIQPILNDLFNQGVTDARFKIVIHSLRHTYGSWLVAQGVDIYKVSRLMRHKTIQMTLRYLHSQDKDLIEAVKKLEQ